MNTKFIVSLITILIGSCNNNEQRINKHVAAYTRVDTLKTELIGKWGGSR